MARTGTVFPAFIGVSYNKDEGGLSALVNDSRRAMREVQKDTEAFGASTIQLGEHIKRAIKSVNEVGKVDFDLPGMNAHAALLERRAEAAKRVAEAMQRAGLAEAAFGTHSRAAISTVEALASKEGAAAGAARDLANAMALVQKEMDRTSASGTRLAVSTDKMSATMIYGGKSAGMAQAGAFSLGQQLQDVAVQYAAGTSAAQIFAMQSGQVSTALSMMGGAAGDTNTRLGRLAAFMGGPWGIAIGVGVSVLGVLATKFLDVKNAASEAEKASQRFADGLLNVEQFADKTTGRMIALAGATNRATLAMLGLKSQETGTSLLSLQKRGFDAAITYNREQGKQTRPGGRPGTIDANRPIRYDPDVSAAVLKAGGPNGNLMVLEREIAAAAKRRPELRGLADDLAKLAAESIDTAKAFRKLGEERDFMTGKRATLPGFVAPEPSSIGNSGSSLRRALTGSTGVRTGADANDAAKAAERAQEELQRTLERVQGQFDKNAVAARAYASSLNDITKLRAEGKIDDGQARAYREKAAAQYFDATADQFTTKVDAGLSDAAGQFRKDLLAGGDALSALLGDRVGRIMTGLAQADLGNGRQNQLGSLLAGVTEGQAAYGGRTRRAEELAMREISRAIEKSLGEDFAKRLGSTIGEVLGAAGAGYGAGQLVLGSSNSKLGSSIGGVLGEKAGEKLAGGAFGKALGKFGEALGPLGAIAGGILGGLVGGLFAGPKPSASAVITSVNNPAALAGNKEMQSALSGVSVNLQSSLQRIIEQLGGAAGAFDVSIGKREDYYRVAGVNTTHVSDKHPERGTGITLLYNGQDANEALRIAILEAFKDGAVQGIREGAKRLLSSNADIEIGVSKASKFEQVFRDLKKYTDPVGAALDSLNLKFRQLKDVFVEAGASTQEFADLQDLYGREREEAIRQVTDQLTSGLKSFLSSITTGDNGLSLRSRQATAQSEYDPLLARVRAGDETAYDAYIAAAQTMLDINRQIYGSGEEYFKLLDEITRDTRGALSIEEAQIKAANDRGAFDATPMVSAMDRQTDVLANILKPTLTEIAENTRAMARTSVSSSNRSDYYADQLGRAGNF